MSILNNEIKLKYIKYFLVLGWFSCWASLSFNPIFLEINLSFLNFMETIQYFRGLFQLIYLPFLIIIIFYLFKKKKFFFEKTNSIFTLFLIFFLIQIIGLIFTDNSLINSYFVISSINVVLTCLIFKKLFSEKECQLVLKLTIFLLGIILIYYGTQYFYYSFIFSSNFYGSWGLVKNFNSELVGVPKPTGLSRTAFIILIFFSIISFFKEKKNYLDLFFIIITSTLIILLSSRTIIFIFIFYTIFHNFYFKNFTIKNSLTNLRNFYIFPFLLIILYGISQNYFNLQKDNFEDKNNSKFTKLFDLKFEKRFTREYSKLEEENVDLTSGRFNDWKNIFDKNKKLFYGNGVMGDRYLINQTASSILLYSYASSGIIGLIMIILISIITLIISLNLIIKIERNHDNQYKLFSAICLISLMLRSLLETSYGIFGIDLMLFCISLVIIQKNKIIKK